MKKIIFCSLLLVLTITTFSQQNIPSPTLTKQEYIKKSKSQKTAAWVLYQLDIKSRPKGLFIKLVSTD